MTRNLTRRHFLQHLAGASAMAPAALALTQAIRAHAGQLQQSGRSAILVWLGGGPATIDLWDMKPAAATGGPFRPIRTSGDVEICEHLPLLAREMHQLAIVRSMSTREADHRRGRYYMQTAFALNPSIEHPSYGAVISHEMAGRVPDLALPPFIAIGGSPLGPGFLGMAYAPMVVDASGNVRHLKTDVPRQRLAERMQILSLLERRFIQEDRGLAATDHAQILDRTLAFLTSSQRAALKVDAEPPAVRQRYGSTPLGRACLMARRLVEQRVPFVEVDFGGWDTHADNFTTLERKLPELDQSLSALVADLAQRGLLERTVILCMGEFGRTPRINAAAGRDHWARAWSCVLGGCGIRGGIAVGRTSPDGTQVESEPYRSENLMASVCHAMGISLETTFTSRSGRPIKIAGGGQVIGPLFS